MPAYVVLHDSSLDEICRLQPTSTAELLAITGIGERKAQLYGPAILSALRRYREGERAAASPEKKTAPALETLQLLAEGKSFEDIARIRRAANWNGGKRGRRFGRERPFGISSGMDRSQQTCSD